MQRLTGDRIHAVWHILVLTLLILGTLLIPTGAIGALSDEVLIHNIDPKDSLSHNLTYGEKVRFILVVEYNGTGDNITVLLSNSTPDQGWNIQTSTDLFVLTPGESQVIRIIIWPDVYEDGCCTDVTLRILAVRDSESHEDGRTYSVLLPIDTPGEDGSKNEDLRVAGFYVDVPDSLDSKIGRFIILVTFWVLMTTVSLVLLDPFIRTFTKRTETNLDDVIVKILRRPIFALIVIYGLIESLDTLDAPSEIMDVLEKLYGIVFFGTVIYTAYNIFIAGLDYLDKLTEDTTLGTKVHHALIPALSKVGSIIFFFIGLNVILGYLGMDLALIMGGMTIMGLVIAFAAQDTLSNFFGGIFLILEPNFKQDDTIILQDITYNVKEIGMRTTQLYDISNHALVIIPNNILANEKIVTLTEPDRHIKMNIEVGVAYGVDIDLVESTLLTIAKSHPEIITAAGEMPFVRFNAFGASSLDFKLVFWVNDLENRFRVRHEIMKRVNKKFEELEIEIPFPQRVITMVNDPPMEEGHDEPAVPPHYAESTPPLAPSPQKIDDPAADAEVKGDTGKPLEEVIKERDAEELLRVQSSGNVDADGFDDGGSDGGGGDGGDD